jgi:hypothetical protein
LSQPMRLSANPPRPPRRSDDGQMILKVACASQKPRLDLLVCGAPLRNRTVDLLLTITTISHPKDRCTGSEQARTLAHASGRQRRPAIASCILPPELPPQNDLQLKAGTQENTQSSTDSILPSWEARLSQVRPPREADLRYS